MNETRNFTAEVTANLIEQIKIGQAPWQRPFTAGEAATRLPINPATGKQFNGINTLHLMAQGRDDPRWLTASQAEASGAKVREGEKATPVITWRFSQEREAPGPDGTTVKTVVPLERPQAILGAVFNAEQIDGMPPHQQAPATEVHKREAVDTVSALLKSSGAQIEHMDYARPFYQPATDKIILPERSSFDGPEDYSITAVQQLASWTAHPSRLDRDAVHPIGSQENAKEQLRTCIASMMIGDATGIGHDPSRYEHLSDAWVRALENDPAEILRAAADASKINAHVMTLGQELSQEQKQGVAVKQVPEGPESWVIKNAATGQLDSAARIAAMSVQQLERTSAIIGSMKPLNAGNEFWQRNKLPYDVEQFDLNITRAAKAINGRLAAIAPTHAPGHSAQQSQQPKPTVAQSADETKDYLAVPYDDRQAASQAGARWDRDAKLWYVGPNADMERLEKWRPENQQHEQAPALPPREGFAQAMRDAGLIVGDGHPVMDGQKHRVEVEGGKKGAVDGFYVGHLDGVPNGVIINNKTGVRTNWKHKGYTLNDAQRTAMRAEAAAKLEARAAEQARLHEATAQRVAKQLEQTAPVTLEHRSQYLKDKGLEPHKGVFTDQKWETTYVPAFDADGKQWNMQYIQQDGTKRFAKDGKKEGCFHPVGGMDALAKAPVIVIGEGYATAASAAESIGHATVAAFDAGNLPHVAKALHAKYPDKPIIIVGDDDKHTQMTSGKNPGREKAEEAAQAVGGVAIFPVFAPEATAWPDDVPKVTPDVYKAHLAATQRLTKAKDGEVELKDGEAEKLRATKLTASQHEALSRMKKHTDFNDLAWHGPKRFEAINRQLRPAVTVVMDNARKRSQQIGAPKHEHERSARIA